MLSILRPSFSSLIYCGVRYNSTGTTKFLQNRLPSSIIWTKFRSFSEKASILKKAQTNLSQREIDELTKEIRKKRNRDTLYYVIGFSIFMLGGCWAAIPIYRMFCGDTSYGGGMGKYKKDQDKIDSMSAIKDRVIKIKFNADAGGTLHWNFKPLQECIYVHPGETALAFFTATNPTEKPIVGVSTYNIVPYEAAAYFNKIQCFCFEEQLLNPGEQVDLPVFFYLDPDYAFDPLLEKYEEIILSYTFFESKSNVLLKRPTMNVQGKMESGENLMKGIALGKGLVETAS